MANLRKLPDMCIEDLPVTNVGYVNNLVLLQAIEKFNIQPTQNVAMKMKEPTWMNYTEIPVSRKFATGARLV